LQNSNVRVTSRLHVRYHRIYKICVFFLNFGFGGFGEGCKPAAPLGGPLVCGQKRCLLPSALAVNSSLKIPKSEAILITLTR